MFNILLGLHIIFSIYSKHSEYENNKPYLYCICSKYKTSFTRIATKRLSRVNDNAFGNHEYELLECDSCKHRIYNQLILS